MKINIGSYSFHSKKEAKEYIRNILYQGDLDRVLSPQEYSFIVSLIYCHPNAKEKIGCGIKEIRIRTGMLKNDRCFEIIRLDKTKEIFSFQKCLGQKQDVFYNFCQACRKAVYPDLLRTKKEFFDKNSDRNKLVKCQTSGELISYSEAHLDHREPKTFSVIVEWFIDKEKINIFTVDYIDDNFGCRLNDDLAQKFIEHHRQHALLRIIKKEINLKKSYLGRISRQKKDIVITS